MKSDILLLTKNPRIANELKHLSNARVHTTGTPSQINKIFKKDGKHLEVALLDLTFSEKDLNRFIFYIKQYKKDMPVLLLSAQHSLSIESEAMRNLDVYGYIKHPDKIEEIEEILEDLNKLFELDMDKKFERVDYLEGEKVFSCTFRDMKKFFLRREDIPDNVDSKIINIVVEDAGHHFTVQYASGGKSVVPWDFVKFICDEKYEYYKQANHANVSAREIGQKIKEHRQSKKLTQEELASKTGIKRTNIARIEAGKHSPSLETLERIAQAFNMPVVYFIAH
jgi:DNA-binding XRE family transcriptional regulator/ActR/RegA family two-component response regulator